MRVRGEATLSASVEEVWRALNDPSVLARTIPGCTRMEEVSTDRYRMTLHAGVASIKGTYQGEVGLSEQQAPDSFVLTASGAGAPGTVRADVRVSLRAAGPVTTIVEYDADAVVGGVIGGVGQRVLVGVAKKTAGEFFRAVDAVLTGSAVQGPAPSGTSGGPPVAVPAVSDAAVPHAAGTVRPVAGTDDFARGVVLGAVAALAGAALGGLLARRRA